MPIMPSSNSEMEDGLDTPEHVESKPNIYSVEGSISNKIKAPLVPSNGKIEVVAVRNGFFNQHRKAEGDKFFVPKIESLGDWMKCIDPVMEKERVKILKAKKKKGPEDLEEENKKLRDELKKLKGE